MSVRSRVRERYDTPFDDVSDITELQEAILTLLERAEIDTAINDQIVKLVEEGERRRRPDAAPLPASRPDALDLAETLAIAASDIRAVASFVSVTGDAADEISDAREAANRVLAALDAYEART